MVDDQANSGNKNYPFQEYNSTGSGLMTSPGVNNRYWDNVTDGGRTIPVVMDTEFLPEVNGWD